MGGGVLMIAAILPRIREAVRNLHPPMAGSPLANKLRGVFADAKTPGALRAALREQILVSLQDKDGRSYPLDEIRSLVETYLSDPQPETLEIIPDLGIGLREAARRCAQEMQHQRPVPHAKEEPCVIIADPLQYSAGQAPLARPQPSPPHHPRPRAEKAIRPAAKGPHGMTRVLEAKGLDPKDVQEWAVKKAGKRNTILMAGAATALAAVGIAVVAMLLKKKDDDTDETASPLVLSERTVAGIRNRIKVLEAKLKEISPEAVVGYDYGSEVEVRGRDMLEARVYSRLIELRERAMRAGKRITVDDLETMLNKGGVTDLRVRLRFYRLAEAYFGRVAETQKRLSSIIDVSGKLPARITDAEKIKKFVGDEFGFIPRGRVELIVRDVHIMTVFYDNMDYVVASAPFDPLWRKDPKEYSEEDKARFAGIMQFADKTSGESFGNGRTIMKNHEYDRNVGIVKHEEGHELDSLGPYFSKFENPWTKPGLKERLAIVSSNVDEEMGTVDAQLGIIYDTNARRSFHTEMIQFLREGGCLSQRNPIARGTIYDPMILGNLENFFRARYASRPRHLDAALARLHAKQDRFYRDVDATYDVFKRLDALFQNDSDFADTNKAKVLAYLAIRGTRDWDLEFLRSFKPGSAQ
jgi:hypothetical protein